jgi:hypothetical protein
MPALAQRAVSECLGHRSYSLPSFRHHAAKLAGGNNAIVLLCNTLPAGAILVALTLIFGPLSGAHFNRPSTLILRCGVGSLGGSPVSISPPRCWAASSACGQHISCSSGRCSNYRRPHAAGPGRAGASGRDLRCALDHRRLRFSPQATPYAVGLYITSAYWFTSSTSFASPAVTIARSLPDTFAGIAPPGVTAFTIAQLVGMLATAALGCWLWQNLNFPSKARPH